MIPDINLLPKVEKRQSTSTKNIYILISIIVLLLVAFFVLQYFKIRGEISTLKEQEQSVLAERDQLEAELDNMTMNTGSLEQSVEFVEMISYPVSPIIDETIRLQPGHSYLREYAFDATTAEVTMDFETLSDISSYLSKLVNSAYFQDVQVTSIEHFEIMPNRVTDEGEEVTVDNRANFYEVPRYEVVFTLFINSNYLAAGGVES
ncbi:MAG: hypothetical protein GX072_11495 [Lysinibacillus sp.]|nr:hypothetical protein [Lysinibacillus sp.]